MPKNNAPLLSDVIKYGIIVLTAGIQIGLFYATRTTVEKHDKEIESLKQENNRQQIDIEILTVRLATAKSRAH